MLTKIGEFLLRKPLWLYFPSISAFLVCYAFVLPEQMFHGKPEDYHLQEPSSFMDHLYTNSSGHFAYCTVQGFLIVTVFAFVVTALAHFTIKNMIPR